jgi:hypothetical protein
MQGGPSHRIHLRPQDPRLLPICCSKIEKQNAMLNPNAFGRCWIQSIMWSPLFVVVDLNHNFFLFCYSDWHYLQWHVGYVWSVAEVTAHKSDHFSCNSSSLKPLNMLCYVLYILRININGSGGCYCASGSPSVPYIACSIKLSGHLESVGDGWQFMFGRVDCLNTRVTPSPYLSRYSDLSIATWLGLQCVEPVSTMQPAIIFVASLTFRNVTFIVVFMLLY